MTGATIGDGPVAAPRTNSRGLRTLIALLVLAVGVIITLRSMVLDTVVINSESMSEALLEGDHVVVNRLALGGYVPFTNIRTPGYSDLRRFDVLFYRVPSRELPLVKRLVGLPGDTIEARGGTIFVNGSPLFEPWALRNGTPDVSGINMRWQLGLLPPSVDRLSYAPTRDQWGPIIVPDGRHLMLGDNRDRSRDSRRLGLVPTADIEGRVVLVYFSYSLLSYRSWAWIREVRWGRIGRVVKGGV